MMIIATALSLARAEVAPVFNYSVSSARAGSVCVSAALVSPLSAARRCSGFSAAAVATRSSARRAGRGMVQVQHKRCQAATNTGLRVCATRFRAFRLRLYCSQIDLFGAVRLSRREREGARASLQAAEAQARAPLAHALGFGERNNDFSLALAQLWLSTALTLNAALALTVKRLFRSSA